MPLNCNLKKLETDVLMKNELRWKQGFRQIKWARKTAQKLFKLTPEEGRVFQGRNQVQTLSQKVGWRTSYFEKREREKTKKTLGFKKNPREANGAGT